MCKVENTAVDTTSPSIQSTTVTTNDNSNDAPCNSPDLRPWRQRRSASAFFAREASDEQMQLIKRPSFFKVGEKEPDNYRTQRRDSAEMVECEGHSAGIGGGILPSGGTGASVYTLCAVSLGAGVFSLPGIASQIGLFAAVALIILLGLMADFALILLIRAGSGIPNAEYLVKQLENEKQNSKEITSVTSTSSNQIVHRSSTSDAEEAITVDEQISLLKNIGNKNLKGLIHSYEDLTQEKLGKIGGKILSIVIALTLFLLNCAHINFAGNLIITVVEYFFTGTINVWQIESWKKGCVYAFLLISITPGTFQTTINSHKYVSTVSVTTVIVIGFCIVIESFAIIGDGSSAIGTSNAAPSVINVSTPAILSSVSVIGVIYSSSLTLFPVVREMKKATYNEASKAIHISQGLCIIVYVSVALFVSLAFGTLVAENALYSISMSHYYFTFLKFCICVTLTLLYPVANLPMVYAINSCFFKHYDDTKWPYRTQVISICGMILCLIVCVTVTDLNDLFGLDGCLGWLPVNYIIPGLIALKSEVGPILKNKYKLGALLLIIIPTIFSMIGFVFIIANIAGIPFTTW